MARKSRPRNTIDDLDHIAKVVTGNDLATNLRDIAGWVQGQLRKGQEARTDNVDLKDLADCQLLGVSSSCSEQTAKMAFRAFAMAHHPDRPGGNENTFKLGQAAFERICQRRRWNPK